MSSPSVDPSKMHVYTAADLAQAEARGRLKEFLLIKKERPINPIYWDMHEERELRAAIAQPVPQAPQGDLLRHLLDEHRYAYVPNGEIYSDIMFPVFVNGIGTCLCGWKAEAELSNEIAYSKWTEHFLAHQPNEQPVRPLANSMSEYGKVEKSGISSEPVRCPNCGSSAPHPNGFMECYVPRTANPQPSTGEDLGDRQSKRLDAEE